MLGEDRAVQPMFWYESWTSEFRGVLCEEGGCAQVSESYVRDFGGIICLGSEIATFQTCFC